MIDIIDLGCGNVGSLTNILATLHIPSQKIVFPEQFKSRTIVLPGVGSAGPYMKKLKDKKFDKAIRAHCENGGRVIGICLGFQLLTQYSEEDGGTQCLGMIDAKTKKLNAGSEGVFSHTGWERLEVNTDFFKSGGCASTLGLTRRKKLDGRVFYNHEYGVCSEGAGCNSIGISNDKYSEYLSMIVQKNIIGIQFHPEKSQITGLKLLEMII